MSYIISLTEAKSYLQVTGTASDAVIQTYIDFTEAEVSAYVGYSLERATYSEVLVYAQSRFDQSDFTGLDTNSGTPNLFLKRRPVSSLSLTVAGVEVPTTSYSYSTSTGIITPTTYLDEPTASYVAGYTTASAPVDLKMVVSQGVASLFNNVGVAKQGSGNISSKTVKDFSVSYGNSQSGYITQVGGVLMKNYLASNSVVLDKYRDILV